MEVLHKSTEIPSELFDIYHPSAADDGTILTLHFLQATHLTHTKNKVNIIRNSLVEPLGSPMVQNIADGCHTPTREISS